MVTRSKANGRPLSCGMEAYRKSPPVGASLGNHRVSPYEKDHKIGKVASSTNFYSFMNSKISLGYF